MKKLSKTVVAKSLGLIASLLLLAYLPVTLGINDFSKYMLFVASISFSSQLTVLGLPIILMRENLDCDRYVYLPSFKQICLTGAIYVMVISAVSILTAMDWFLQYLVATAGLVVMRINIGIMRGLGLIFIPQIFDGTLRNLMLSAFLFMNLAPIEITRLASGLICITSLSTIMIIVFMLVQRKWKYNTSKMSFLSSIKIFSGNDIQKVIENLFITFLPVLSDLTIVGIYTWVKKFFSYSYEFGSMINYTYIEEIRRNLKERTEFCKYKTYYAIVSIVSLSIFCIILSTLGALNYIPLPTSEDFFLVCLIIVIASAINIIIGPVMAWGSLIGQEKYLLNTALIKVFFFLVSLIICYTLSLQFIWLISLYYFSIIFPNLIYIAQVKNTAQYRLAVYTDLYNYIRAVKL